MIPLPLTPSHEVRGGQGEGDRELSGEIPTSEHEMEGVLLGANAEQSLDLGHRNTSRLRERVFSRWERIDGDK